MFQTATLLAISEWPGFLNDPATLIFMIPIVAILVGGIISISKMLVRHRERMTMIERGMHPDHPQESKEPGLGQ